jgi:putative drug exporter of the RND superfamily
VVNRFREERAADSQRARSELASPAASAVDTDVEAAVARTVATAGRTVVYSGLTVAAVLAGLLVFPEPFLRSMGVAGVGVVAVVVVAAIPLLPALLVLGGRRIRPARAERAPAPGPARAERAPSSPAPGPVGGGRFARIARAVQRRPLATLLAAAAVMVLFALPVLDLRLAQVDARLLPDATQTRQLHDATAEHFPELDRPDPIVIAVAAPAEDPAVAALRGQIAAVPHVTEVTVAGSGPVTALRAGIDVPSHSAAARRAVAAIRALDAPVEVAVTGDTALLVDYQDMITDRLPYAVAIIALGTLVLLFLFTGSILLPVKAVATNVLSIGAALGAVVWVFQQGHLANWFGTTRLDATHVSVPVLVAAIAFGLSVDYEVFLLSRIRERWLATGDNHAAVAEGLQHTGRIITSAALLLAIVFAGFLVAGFVPVQAIGLGLTLAVALDATVVRLLLVPATMTLAGRYNWWAPGPLRRLHDRLGLAEQPPVRESRTAADAVAPAAVHDRVPPDARLGQADGGAKNSSAMLSGSLKDSPDP